MVLSYGGVANIGSRLVLVQPGNDVNCAYCNIVGVIGQTLQGREAGMVPGIQMKKIDYLCRDCAKKMPIDKQQKADPCPF